VLELTALAQRLARPARHGAPGAPSFHVVVPALPGFPLSGAPTALRAYTAASIADRWAQLMEALGYERFAASGGDVGARVSAWLGARHPQRVLGVHLSANALWPALPDASELAPPERAWVAERQAWTREEGAYMHLQQTKPLTLAHGLADSPAGLAAWIVEKFRAWSDCGGEIESVIARDDLLANISLYWFTGAIGSSFWPYYARLHGPWPVPEGGVGVPTGYAEFPHEILRPPRSLAARVYTDIRRWTTMPKGGHFAAMEQPEALAHEITEFFRPLRGR